MKNTTKCSIFKNRHFVIYWKPTTYRMS